MTEDEESEFNKHANGSKLRELYEHHLRPVLAKHSKVYVIRNGQIRWMPEKCSGLPVNHPFAMVNLLPKSASDNAYLCVSYRRRHNIKPDRVYSPHDITKGVVYNIEFARLDTETRFCS